MTVQRLFLLRKFENERTREDVTEIPIIWGQLEDVFYNSIKFPPQVEITVNGKTLIIHNSVDFGSRESIHVPILPMNLCIGDWVLLHAQHLYSESEPPRIHALQVFSPNPGFDKKMLDEMFCTDVTSTQLFVKNHHLYNHGTLSSWHDVIGYENGFSLKELFLQSFQLRSRHLFHECPVKSPCQFELLFENQLNDNAQSMVFENDQVYNTQNKNAIAKPTEKEERVS